MIAALARGLLGQLAGSGTIWVEGIGRVLAGLAARTEGGWWMGGGEVVFFHLFTTSGLVSDSRRNI